MCQIRRSCLNSVCVGYFNAGLNGAWVSIMPCKSLAIWRDKIKVVGTLIKSMTSCWQDCFYLLTCVLSDNSNQREMSDKGWTDLLEQFRILGGVAENICQRDGAHGRGIFPEDPEYSSKVITPRNLLLKRESIGINNERILINDESTFSIEEKSFLESYYNEFSWGNGGNRDSVSFLKYIFSMPKSIRVSLVKNHFIDESLLRFSDSQEHVLRRFADERAVRFGQSSVLAPIWEFINHSTYAAPFRITRNGVETPPIDPSDQEILFKYSGKNSPISMWRKYGFASRSIVAYSIPFEIKTNHGSFLVKCCGQQGLGPGERKKFTLEHGSVLIKSIAVGCLSSSLPLSSFDSILTSLGMHKEVAQRLMPEIQEINVKTRAELLSALRAAGLGNQSELYKALTYEIELIQNST